MSCRAVAVMAKDRVGSPRVASHYLDKALVQVKKYQAWVAEFPATLSHAKKISSELAGELVWQDDLVEFWQPFTVIQRELFRLYDEMRDVNTPLADLIEPYIDPPAHAQIEYATDHARFLERAGQNRRQIAYEVPRLETWYKNFARWVTRALEEIRAARRDI